MSELVTEIERTDDELVITRNGRPAAVLVSADEFDSWRETHEIRRDPDLMRQIRRGLRQLERGDSATFEEVFGEPLVTPKRRR